MFVPLTVLLKEYAERHAVVIDVCSYLVYSYGQICNIIQEKLYCRRHAVVIAVCSYLECSFGQTFNFNFIQENLYCRRTNTKCRNP